MNSELELTILMPCLNESETLKTCINKAKSFLEKNNVSGEVLIVDNGSTDDSRNIAESCGARVEIEDKKGYGAALIRGSKEAKGKYVIMGDADDSYDFINLMPFLEKLREGYKLVMGNRFAGGIEKGAMPPLHKYIGNPILSCIGRKFYHTDVTDFHCGLSGYNREAINLLNLQSTGMEYASEMVAKASLNKLEITQVPTTLKKDGRSKPPHLRSFRDGWRHLKFLLMYCPNALFFTPGLICLIIGLTLTIILSIGPIEFANIVLDIHTLLYASMLIIIGVNVLLFALYTKVFAIHSKYIPYNKTIVDWENITLEKGLIFGIILVLIGISISIFAFNIWKELNFSELEPAEMMRLTIPALDFIIIGTQIVFSSFFMNILKIRPGE